MIAILVVRRLLSIKRTWERIEKEEKEYMHNFMTGPYINIESDKYFGIHQDVLREHKASPYQGRRYNLGKRVDLHYLSSTGTRIYL